MPIQEVELNIPSELKGDPFFYNIIKNFEVVVYILEASFSTETAWAIVKLEGDEAEINRLFYYLKGKGVQVKLR